LEEEEEKTRYHPSDKRRTRLAFCLATTNRRAIEEKKSKEERVKEKEKLKYIIRREKEGV